MLCWRDKDNSRNPILNSFGLNLDQGFGEGNGNGKVRRSNHSGNALGNVVGNATKSVIQTQHRR